MQSIETDKNHYPGNIVLSLSHSIAASVFSPAYEVLNLKKKEKKKKKTV